MLLQKAELDSRVCGLCAWSYNSPWKICTLPFTWILANLYRKQWQSLKNDKDFISFKNILFFIQQFRIFHVLPIEVLLSAPISNPKIQQQVMTTLFSDKPAVVFAVFINIISLLDRLHFLRDWDFIDMLV